MTKEWNSCRHFLLGKQLQTSLQLTPVWQLATYPQMNNILWPTTHCSCQTAVIYSKPKPKIALINMQKEENNDEMFHIKTTICLIYIPNDSVTFSHHCNLKSSASQKSRYDHERLKWLTMVPTTMKSLKISLKHHPSKQPNVSFHSNSQWVPASLT